MSNQWFRLWHEMPNDPKWRTIARVSKQRIGDVISVYLHVLVEASANATERGRTQSVCVESIATALDLDDDQVHAILDAMQGRVLDGDCVVGWSKRQPEREDGSAERAKAWRERKKEERERTRTQPNAEERPDKDKDKDKKEPPLTPPCRGGESPGPPAESQAEPLPNPAAANLKRERKDRVCLKTFLDRCRQAGEKAISNHAPLLEYVDRTGLPLEFIQIAWEVFKAEHLPSGGNGRRLQADWRRHFMNYVTKGYYRLWYATADGQYALTTAGVQAQKMHAEEVAA